MLSEVPRLAATACSPAYGERVRVEEIRAALDLHNRTGLRICAHLPRSRRWPIIACRRRSGRPRTIREIWFFRLKYDATSREPLRYDGDRSICAATQCHAGWLRRVVCRPRILRMAQPHSPRGLDFDAWNRIQSLAALSLLAGLGIRYPLQMLPVLLFELRKAIWLVAIALPRWVANDVDPDIRRMAITCLAAMVIVPLLIPWPYVFRNYVMKPGDRWR